VLAGVGCALVSDFAPIDPVLQLGWHILLPAFTVGLASFIAFLEGAYTLTKRRIFLNLSQFWLRIFAVSFGMGVVTGIV
jgi:cytochrome bd ubiquinol oxidase subunit I